MPSAPDWLRKKFMTGETDGIAEAEAILRTHHTIDRGMIRPKDAKNHEETPEEYEAIMYLIHEWDYGWED